MKTLIKNAETVLPGGEIVRANVLIEGTRIAAVAPGLGTLADEEVDARGLHLLPGVIDDQVHFREPGATHKEDLVSASRACVRGGVTSFLEMPNTRPSTTTHAALHDKLERARMRSMANYGFYLGATPDNVDVLRVGDRTPGIKIFMGSSTGSLLVDEQDALERIFAETVLPICVHAEDEATVRANREALEREGRPLDVADHSRIRTAEAALRATRRAVDLALRHHHRLHLLHVSTGDEVDAFADPHGLLTAEACPHHLFFNTDDYARLGTLVQMNPSLKTRHDNQRLWQALRAGYIQVIATDHAPHTLEEKARPYPESPSGLPAVENSLALMLDASQRGLCTLAQVVRWMCEAPARVWDLVGKGAIREGWDADLVLVDLNKTAAVRNADQQTKCGWSPWDGQTLSGWPVRTWVLGREVYREGRFDNGARGGEIRFDHVRGGYWATCDFARAD